MHFCFCILQFYRRDAQYIMSINDDDLVRLLNWLWLVQQHCWNALIKYTSLWFVWGFFFRDFIHNDILLYVLITCSNFLADADSTHIVFNPGFCLPSHMPSHLVYSNHGDQGLSNSILQNEVIPQSTRDSTDDSSSDESSSTRESSEGLIFHLSGLESSAVSSGCQPASDIRNSVLSKRSSLDSTRLDNYMCADASSFANSERSRTLFTSDPSSSLLLPDLSSSESDSDTCSTDTEPDSSSSDSDCSSTETELSSDSDSDSSGATSTSSLVALSALSSPVSWTGSRCAPVTSSPIPPKDSIPVPRLQQNAARNFPRVSTPRSISPMDWDDISSDSSNNSSSSSSHHQSIRGSWPSLIFHMSGISSGNHTSLEDHEAAVSDLVSFLAACTAYCEDLKSTSLNLTTPLASSTPLKIDLQDACQAEFDNSQVTDLWSVDNILMCMVVLNDQETNGILCIKNHKLLMQNLFALVTLEGCHYDNLCCCQWLQSWYHVFIVHTIVLNIKLWITDVWSANSC